jgi:hypothetical protein
VQDGRGITAATKVWTNPDADVTCHLCEVGVEVVSNRDTADNLPSQLSNEERRRHPALRDVNAKA